MRFSKGAVLAAGLALGACATAPSVNEYTVEIPPGVVDGRSRFADIFCTVLEDGAADLPDYRPCEQALSPVRGTPARVNGPVSRGASGRRLVAAIVAGVGYDCFAKWLDPPGSAAAHVAKYGYGQIVIPVDALSGTETNARQIRDAIMAMPMEPGGPRLVLVGYSKGGPDILTALVEYPEILDRVAAVVSAAGAIGGSALANDARQETAELLMNWPGAKCDEGDGRAVESLRPDVRKAWLASHALPAGPRYYSLVTLPTPDRVSRAISGSHRKLGKIDWRNDSQVIYSDQIIPDSTLLAFLNADHWAIAVPLNRSHPVIGSTLVNRNDYPREALLEALLRFVEEDLDRNVAR